MLKLYIFVLALIKIQESWKFYESIKSCCTFYILGYNFFLMCVSTWIKYACKDEWLVAIETLQKDKNKAKKAIKKGIKKKMI